MLLLPVFSVLSFVFAHGADTLPRVDKQVINSGGLEVNLAKRQIAMDATVCLDVGILEYLVCRPRTFEHEAFFSTKCKPSLLHYFLLALDLEPASSDAQEDSTEKPRDKTKSRVRIEVEYEKNGKTIRQPINELLVNRERKDGVVSDSWVFAGSHVYREDERNIYAADITGAIIGLGIDGSAVLQFDGKIGIPYRGEDQGVRINTAICPPSGTRVRLIVSPRDLETQTTAKQAP